MRKIEHRELTQAELVKEATERFGGDPYGWAFQCPACGDVASGADFREALARKERKNATVSDVLGQECIGRLLGALEGGPSKDGGRSRAERGCDWCAYGLFPAPWTVKLPDGKTISCFPLAPAPEEG